MIENTVMFEDKIHKFATFNRARKFARKNGVEKVIVNIKNYWNKKDNLIHSVYSFNYSA